MDYSEMEMNLILFNELAGRMRSTVTEDVKPIILKYLQQSNVQIEQIQKELERLKQNIIKKENEIKMLDTVLSSAKTERILKAVYTMLYVTNNILEDKT